MSQQNNLQTFLRAALICSSSDGSRSTLLLLDGPSWYHIGLVAEEASLLFIPSSSLERSEASGTPSETASVYEGGGVTGRLALLSLFSTLVAVILLPSTIEEGALLVHWSLLGTVSELK